MDTEIIEKALIKISPNSRVFSPEIKSFNESATIIRGMIFGDQYTINPSKGDLYLRFNPKNNGIFAAVFTGKSSKFYAWQDCMGEETHYIEQCDINDLLGVIGKMSTRLGNFDLEEKINKAMSKYPSLPKIFTRD